MLILFLCPWKFMVMESDWFNANESHATARCLPFVLNTKVRLRALFVVKQINCKNLDKFFPSLLLLFHNPIQNHIPEGETACPHQLSQPFVKQDSFCSRLCCLSKEARMWMGVWSALTSLLPNLEAWRSHFIRNLSEERSQNTCDQCQLVNPVFLGVRSTLGPSALKLAEVSQPGNVRPGMICALTGWRFSWVPYEVDGRWSRTGETDIRKTKTKPPTA